MANVAITEECRHKLAYVLKPDESLGDGVKRIVDETIKRDNIIVPPYVPKEHVQTN